MGLDGGSSVITDDHRALVGVETGPVNFVIEAGAVERFCTAVGLADPIYTDPAAAQAAGYRERPVPAGFWCSIGAAVGLRRPDFSQHGTRTMNGATDFEYLKPAHVGQTLACTARVSAIYEKRGSGGQMVFTVLEEIWRDESGEVVTKGRMTIIRL